MAGTTLLLALGAGALTALNPCVLPVLPLVMGSALAGGRLGPLAFVGGLTLAFATAGLFVATIGLSLGIDAAALKSASAIVLALAGLVLLVPALQERLALAVAPIGGRLSERAGGAPFGMTGARGQFLVGGLMGIAWAPCTGPTLAAAVSLAATGGSLPQAGLTMLVFALGAGVPMLALAYGSRDLVMRRRDGLRAIARHGKPALGALLLAVAVMMLTGFDRRLEAALVEAMPDWLVGLTTML